MRHAPAFLNRCRRSWCKSRRAPLSLAGLCAQHEREVWSSDKARRLIDQLARRKPVVVSAGMRR